MLVYTARPFLRGRLAPAALSSSRLNASELQTLNLPKAIHDFFEVFLILGEPAIEGIAAVPCDCRAWSRTGRKRKGIRLLDGPVWARKCCVRPKCYCWEKCRRRICIGIHEA